MLYEIHVPLLRGVYKKKQKGEHFDLPETVGEELVASGSATAVQTEPDTSRAKGKSKAEEK